MTHLCPNHTKKREDQLKSKIVEKDYTIALLRENIRSLVSLQLKSKIVEKDNTIAKLRENIRILDSLHKEERFQKQRLEGEVESLQDLMEIMMFGTPSDEVIKAHLA